MVSLYGAWRRALRLVAYAALAVQPVFAAGYDAPADTLTLDDALRRTFEASPHLRAARLELEAREALARQAGRFSNPVLDAEAENIGATGPEQGVVTVALAQLVELGGDRAARRRLATREADLAAADLALARTERSALARSRYAEAVAAQARLGLALASAHLTRATLVATAEQVEAGDRSPVDETRAEVALAIAQAEATQAQAERTAAFVRLAALWTESPDFDAVAALPPPEPVPAFDVLAGPLRQSAALAVWDVETARREVAVDLEKARRIPDVTVSAGYRRFTATGGGAAVVGLAVPLPVFDRNGGAVAAARARLQAADAEREVALVEARSALAEAHGALTASFAEATAFRIEVLPRAEDVAARIEEGYEAGKFSLLDVLDAQRTLAAARVRYADALAAYHTAAADVERLTARPIRLTDQP
ncbi:MAG: TolC family protein [Rhodothermales bacterium]